MDSLGARDCPVCSRRFDASEPSQNPKLLLCAHTVCSKCVGQSHEKTRQENKNSLACPKCDEVQTLDETGLDGLPLDLSMLECLSLLAALKDGEGETKHSQEKEDEDGNCENCSEHPSSIYCTECDLAICESCSAQIHKLGAFKKHKPTEGPRPVSEPHCEKHGSKLTLFCSTHKVPLCSDCEDHRDHDCVRLQNVITEHKIRLEKQINQLNERMVALFESTSRVSTASKVLLKNYTTATKNIKTQHEDALKPLVERQEQLLNQVASQRDQKKESLCNHRRMMAKCISRLRADCEYAAAFLGTDMLKLAKDADGVISQMQSSLAESHLCKDSMVSDVSISAQMEGKLDFAAEGFPGSMRQPREFKQVDKLPVRRHSLRRQSARRLSGRGKGMGAPNPLADVVIVPKPPVFDGCRTYDNRIKVTWQAEGEWQRIVEYQLQYAKKYETFPGEESGFGEQNGITVPSKESNEFKESHPGEAGADTNAEDAPQEDPSIAKSEIVDQAPEAGLYEVSLKLAGGAPSPEPAEPSKSSASPSSEVGESPGVSPNQKRKNVKNEPQDEPKKPLGVDVDEPVLPVPKHDTGRRRSAFYNFFSFLSPKNTKRKRESILRGASPVASPNRTTKNHPGTVAVSDDDKDNEVTPRSEPTPTGVDDQDSDNTSHLNPQPPEPEPQIIDYLGELATDAAETAEEAAKIRKKAENEALLLEQQGGQGAGIRLKNSQLVQQEYADQAIEWSTVHSITDQRYILGNLEEKTTYLLRLRARNKVGWGSYGFVRELTTKEFLFEFDVDNSQSQQFDWSDDKRSVERTENGHAYVVANRGFSQGIHKWRAEYFLTGNWMFLGVASRQFYPTGETFCEPTVMGIASTDRQYKVNKTMARISKKLFQQFYKWDVTNVVDMVLDCDASTLTYSVFGTRARYTVRGLPEGSCWYPHFGMYYKGSHITLTSTPAGL